jgi:hypothetical protein
VIEETYGTVITCLVKETHGTVCSGMEMLTAWISTWDAARGISFNALHSANQCGVICQYMGGGFGVRP